MWNLEDMRAAIFTIVFAILVQAAAAGADDKAWQQKAIAKYPSLGVQGSEFNKKFVEAYNQRRKSNPNFFTNQQWPLLLADELATSQAPTASPRPTIEHAKNSSTAPKTDVTPSDGSWWIWAIGAVVLLWVIGAVRQMSRKARIVSQAKKYIALANHQHALPVIGTDMILKNGESAFYSAPASLYETRAVRQYQSGFAGFRVAKGVYIGGSKGRSFSTQEWTKIDNGKLVITNKRLIFAGNGSDRALNVSKVVHVSPMKDAIEISAEGRQKGMAFTAENPLIVAAIIRICAEATDPLDLTDTPLNFHFS